MENTNYEVTDEITEVYDDAEMEVRVLSESETRRIKGLGMIGGAALVGGAGFLGYKAFGWWKRNKAEKALLQQLVAEKEALVEKTEEDEVQPEVKG